MGLKRRTTAILGAGAVLDFDGLPKPTTQYISGQWLPRNQAGDAIFYSPIITGLKKTDKLCFMPHNFYHANLARKIIENRNPPYERKVISI